MWFPLPSLLFSAQFCSFSKKKSKSERLIYLKLLQVKYLREQYVKFKPQLAPRVILSRASTDLNLCLDLHGLTRPVIIPSFFKCTCFFCVFFFF